MADTFQTVGGVSLSLILADYRAKKSACGGGGSTGCGCGGGTSTVAGDGTVYIVNDIVTGGAGGSATSEDCCCKIQRQVVVTDAAELLKLASGQCIERTESLEVLRRIMRRLDALETGTRPTTVSLIAVAGRTELFYDETVLTTPEVRVTTSAT